MWFCEFGWVENFGESVFELLVIVVVLMFDGDWYGLLVVGLIEWIC